MKRNFYILFLWMLTLIFKVNAQNVLQESFEGTFPPTGWTLVNAGTGNPWTQNTTTTYAYSGTRSMQYAYNIASAANAWAFTPALPLAAGSTYSITFYVRARGATFPESLKFTVGNTNTVAAQTTTLLDSANITNLTFRRWATTYTPTTTGNYNFGFNCYSAANQFNLYIDSVSIYNNNAPPCTGTPVAGTISASPSSLCSTGSVALSVSGASSAPGLTYQWQSSPTGANNFSNIAGATTNTYTATISASTDFRRITTCAGAGTSATSSSVTVLITGTPTNDSFCNPIALSLNAASVCGNTTCATSGSFDPAFTSSTPNNTVWYTYTPTTTGAIQARFKRPAGVTTGLLNGWIGIYTITGTCPTPTFTQMPAVSGYDLTTSDSVTITFPSLTAGTTYYLMIDGNSGASGAFCIQLLSPPAPPACTTNITPANGATGVAYLPGIQLTWNTVAGATGYDLYFGTSATTLSNLGTAATNTISITGASPNTTYYWYIAPRNINPATNCQSSITSFTTGALPAPPANDSCGAAIALVPNVATPGTTVVATQSAVAETCSGGTSTSALDVWYTINAVGNGSATITLTNLSPTFDGVLAVYSGTCIARTLISCTDEAGSGSTGNETLTLTGLVSGQTYIIRVYGWSGSSGTFTITASGPALPVTGVNLTATRNSKNVQLGWQTLTEMNNAGFELQRSADGNSFASFLKVASKANGGNSTAAINYTADDVKPFAGANYYRLKQTDKDGKISYSNVVFVKGLAVSNLTLSAIYPNPTHDVLKAAIQSPATEKVTFVVSDMMGKVISRQVSNVTSGDNTVNLNVASLPSGNYLLKVVCNNGCETAVQKFTKQ